MMLDTASFFSDAYFYAALLIVLGYLAAFAVYIRMLTSRGVRFSPISRLIIFLYPVAAAAIPYFVMQGLTFFSQIPCLNLDGILAIIALEGALTGFTISVICEDLEEDEDVEERIEWKIER